MSVSNTASLSLVKARQEDHSSPECLRCHRQVLSGGVASNQYIRKALGVVAEATGLQLLCPPAKFCTDNGVMIAWNGVERLREGRGVLPPSVDVSYKPK